MLLIEITSRKLKKKKSFWSIRLGIFQTLIKGQTVPSHVTKMNVLWPSLVATTQFLSKNRSMKSY